MANTVTLVVITNGLTSSAYKSGAITSQVELALQSAFIYCFGKKPTMTRSGSDLTDYYLTDEGESMAVCLLAAAFLQEGRKAVRARSDNSLVPRSIDQLFSQEMFEMLIGASEVDPDTWGFFSSNPTEDYEDFTRDPNVYG